MTTKERIIKALKSGEQLTRKQGERKFGLGFTQRVSELRSEGYPNIYTNKEVKNGKTKFVYRYGKPSKEMVASAKTSKLQVK